MIAILQANLGNFDTPVDPVEQSVPTFFHRWTDDNFPPIAGLTPRMQYRIPKLFGWEMFPGYEHYIWLDGSVSFKRKMLPYIYHAPWALGIHRFDDIFAGIESKREIDAKGWAAVSGYARVHHERASNTFTNLKNEAPGLELNEKFWRGNEDHEYFKIYRKKYRIWKEFIKKCRI